MKINGIKALDYNLQDANLVLVLADTDVPTILAMDTSVLTVKTDDGDTVDAFPGWNLKSITYDVKAGSYVTILDRLVEDTTARAVDQMRDELVKTKQLLDTAVKQNQEMAAGIEDLDGTKKALEDAKAKIAAMEANDLQNKLAMAELAESMTRSLEENKNSTNLAIAELADAVMNAPAAESETPTDAPEA